MITILVLVGIGTLFFLGLIIGIRFQDIRRERAATRRRRNASSRVHTHRPRVHL